MEILNYSTGTLTTVFGLLIPEKGERGRRWLFFFFSFLFPSAYQLYLEKSGFNYTKCFILGCSKLKPDPAQISRATSGFGLHICEEPVKLLRVFVLVLPSADW